MRACRIPADRVPVPRRTSRFGKPGPAAWRALALGGLLLASPLAQAGPPEMLAHAELAPVRTFLERSSGPRPGSTDVIELLRADLDADGREELVVLWGLFGASSSWPALTVFREGPRGWREAGTRDLAGRPGRLVVQGREIVLELRSPTPDDPRCCPSGSDTRRFRWDGRALVELM